MIDNILMKLTEVNNIKEIIKALNPYPIKDKNNNQLQYYFGKLENLRIKINPYEHSIVIIGSLPKFLYGNNDISFTRSDIEKAINKLNEILKIDLNQGNVYKLEISDNIIMKHGVNQYLQFLGFSKRLKRNDYKGTIYFNNKRKTLAFYDKSKEMRKRKLYPISDNILRYELRFYKRFAKQLKIKEIKVYMLYDEIFYIKLCKLWVKNYLNIIKLNFDVRLISLLGFKSKNINDLMIELESYNSQDKANMKRKLIKHLSIDNYGNSMITELTTKLKNSILHYR
jgi:hypothetical protein